MITTLAVFAVTLTFAQDHGKDGKRINPKNGKSEQIVRVRAQKEMHARNVADLKKSDFQKDRKVDMNRAAKPAVKVAVKKHKAKLQHKKRMAPKGNFKTK